jgi:hypothetical protein
MDFDNVTGFFTQGEAPAAPKERGITINTAHVEYATNRSDANSSEDPSLGNLIQNITPLLAIERDDATEETINRFTLGMEKTYDFYPAFPSVGTVLPGDSGDSAPLPSDRVRFNYNHFNNPILFGDTSSDIVA